MAAAHTNALSLLGKSVSFEYLRHVQLTEQSSIDFREKISGVVTAVTVYLDGSPEILIDDGDFHVLSEVQNFQLAQ